ncbi:MAG TPA: hypothetical protein VLZ54_00080 [Arenibacter sp.]|nr:hypothetical protein [Arenibacter sp.]
MINNQDKKYLELNIDREFGEIINLYFDFFKANIKKFTNIFLSYNGIFLIGLVLVSYLLVSGILTMVGNEQSLLMDSMETTGQGSWIYLAVGGILFSLIFFTVAVMNYSLSTSYMIHYEEHKGTGFEKSDVWTMIIDNLGKIVVFILILIVLFFGLMIVALILAIIPLVGMLAQYVIQYFLMAWAGVSFFALLKENRSVTDSLQEGWNLVYKNFWRAVGVNFILGLLIGLLFMVVLMVPGILIGIYTFHVVQSGVDISGSVVPTLVYTLGTCILLITVVYSQCLSQFVNGILYFALREKTYNLHARSKIDQIGSQDL